MENPTAHEAYLESLCSRIDVFNMYSHSPPAYLRSRIPSSTTRHDASTARVCPSCNSRHRPSPCPVAALTTNTIIHMTTRCCSIPRSGRCHGSTRGTSSSRNRPSTGRGSLMHSSFLIHPAFLLGRSSPLHLLRLPLLLFTLSCHRRPLGVRYVPGRSLPGWIEYETLVVLRLG